MFIKLTLRFSATYMYIMLAYDLVHLILAKYLYWTEMYVSSVSKALNNNEIRMTCEHEQSGFQLFLKLFIYFHLFLFVTILLMWCKILRFKFTTFEWILALFRLVYKYQNYFKPLLKVLCFIIFKFYLSSNIWNYIHEIEKGNSWFERIYYNIAQDI